MKYNIFVSAMVRHKYTIDAESAGEAMAKYESGQAKLDFDYLEYDKCTEEALVIEAKED